ncbi:MAG: hypothetical protein LM574_04390 [Archaeoglobus sp.]|jgi:uncharacterized protein HemY|nr:hypothetical protein [Archaeoglobus sp.]
MNLASLVGFFVGFLFGISSISTMLSFAGNVLIEIEESLRNLNAVSTVILLIIALILIVKIRAVASLIAGAIVGAVLNLILAQQGINVLEIIKTNLGF